MKITYLNPHKRSLIALSIAATFPAIGQDLTKNNDTSDADDIEKIEVVGQFQQSLVNRIPLTSKELPFTLNILDRDFLDARNFTRPTEALTTLPNITRTEDRLGIGTAGFLSRGFEAPILVDNRVQNTFRGTGTRDDSFVESYEVLKGPASISLGPIGPGGVINTVTKVPTIDEFVDADLRLDQFGSVSGDIDVNFGEITDSDTVLFRISGAYRDFQFDADEAKRETIAIRPVAIFNLGDATSIRTSIAYTEHTVNPNAGFPLLESGDIPSQIDTDTFTGFANGEGVSEDTLYEAEINHEFLDNLKLTVRGSRQETDFDYTNTSGLYNYSDRIPGLGANETNVYSYSGGGETESEQTFFDMQLAYQKNIWGQQQDFVFGVAYDESAFERLFAAFVLAGPFQLSELDQPRFGPDDIGPVSPSATSDSKLNSVFAEAAIRPNDWLTITGGLRYDDLEQSFVRFRRGVGSESPFDDDEITFRLGASAEVSDEINVYASFAQAFTPQFGIKRNNEPASAELSDGFELGAKGSAFDGTLNFEAGFFHTIRKDVAVQDPNNLPGEIPFVVTIGEVTLDGFEFTGRLNPIDGLNINVSLGITDVDITEAGNDEITEPVFPETTGSVYFSYEIQSGPLVGLTLGGGLRYIDERKGPFSTYDSYTVSDINVSYPINGNIDLSLDILNVTDELYLENAASFAQRLNGGSVLGPPRTAVLTIRSSF
ncbi:MAG: TonB-dependent receptor [Pseudomonadota bacterium]